MDVVFGRLVWSRDVRGSRSDQAENGRIHRRCDVRRAGIGNDESFRVADDGDHLGD